ADGEARLMTTTHTASTTKTGDVTLHVHPIAEARLDAMREQGHDEHGNTWAPHPAIGWEPLRCCLHLATEGESIVLISYAPLTTASAWTEVGPIYVHAQQCAGYTTPDDLPTQLRTGPRVLRGYDEDGTLLYDHVTVVDEGVDLAAPIRELLASDAVDTVHVRALATQCFTYAVTRG